VIFIDTGAWLARFDRRDQFHSRALEAWFHLEEEKERCATSNLVLAEALTLLARRAGYAFAARQARTIYRSRSLAILRPAQETEMEAISLFEKLSDQAVSFTDCVSFQLMREKRLHEVFGFDRHFEAVGFTIWPPK